MDDYRFMEDGFNEDILSIVKSYTYENTQTSGTPPPMSFIVSGCKLTGNVFLSEYNWEEGAVLINGLIYKVYAGSAFSFDYMTHGIYFVTSIETPVEGQENFKDGSLHSTYGIRVATPTVLPLGTNLLQFTFATPRFLSNVWSGELNFRQVGGTGNPAYSGGWSYIFTSAPGLGFRKNQINEVEFRGYCERSASSNQIIFTLPLEYRPAQTMGELLFPVIDIYSHNAYTLFINCTNGQVGIGPSTAPSNVGFELSSIRFAIK